MKNSFTYGFYDELSKLAAAPALAALLPALGRAAAQVAGGYVVNKALTPSEDKKPLNRPHHPRAIGEAG